MDIELYISRVPVKLNCLKPWTDFYFSGVTTFDQVMVEKQPPIYRFIGPSTKEGYYEAICLSTGQLVVRGGHHPVVQCPTTLITQDADKDDPAQELGKLAAGQVFRSSSIAQDFPAGTAEMVFMRTTEQRANESLVLLVYPIDIRYEDSLTRWVDTTYPCNPTRAVVRIPATH